MVISGDDPRVEKSHVSRYVAVKHYYKPPQVLTLGAITFVAGVALGSWLTWWQLAKAYAEIDTGQDVGFTGWFMPTIAGTAFTVSIVATAAVFTSRRVRAKRIRSTNTGPRE